MKPVILCILDGVGITDRVKGNAFMAAKKPNFDNLWNTYPHSLLSASGEDVGLPSGQMGNSEVGHMNLGAGRVVYQPLQFINKSIKDGDFYNNIKFLDIIDHVNRNNSSLHLLGLLSDGGIHSHINHLFALLKLCKEKNVKKVYIHVFTDGRDTSPNSSINFLEKLDNKINELGIGKIATISGRYYAMDRDNRYERIKKTYDVIVEGVGPCYSSYKEVIEDNYENNITDEFIIPSIIDKEGIINDNDGLIVFNYRPDRLRELFSAITNKGNNCFDRTIRNNIKLTTMMPVSDEVIYENAYELPKLDNTLGEYVSSLGLKQLRIAETEKYAHVTYFFDGGIEKDLPNCKRILIPSPKVTTYDLKPEMSAYEITDTLIKELDNDYDLVILNYANGDMVGHTGVFDAAVKAVEVLDECLGRLYTKVQEKNGVMLILADHGNCEYMIDDNDNVVTSHSTNKVPCIVTDKCYSIKDGKLSDVAPTLLTLLDKKVPKEMTGTILIDK